MDVKDLIKDPIFNHSVIAEKLYGSKESKNRTKVSKKVNGVNQWHEWEIERLKEVFTALKNKIGNG